MCWLAPRDRLRWSIKSQAIRRAPTGTNSSEHQSEVSNASVSAPHVPNQSSSLENIHEFEEVCSSIPQKEVRTSNTHPEIRNAETWNYHGNDASAHHQPQRSWSRSLRTWRRSGLDNLSVERLKVANFTALRRNPHQVCECVQCLLTESVKFTLNKKNLGKRSHQPCQWTISILHKTTTI